MDGSIPAASFTVKYEMENYLSSEICPLGKVTVYRIEDIGRRIWDKPKVTDITENYYE
jgi:hypothetical protein